MFSMLNLICNSVGSQLGVTRQVNSSNGDNSVVYKKILDVLSIIISFISIVFLIILKANYIDIIVLTIIVLILLSIFYCKLPWNRHWLPLNCVVIGFFAGAIGNLIDRLMYQYVVDFFYFKLINFPIFNVADIYVTLSAALLIISVLFLYKEQDFESVFPPKTDKKAKKDM